MWVAFWLHTPRGTPLSTALNLAATSMGTGLLTLPHTFARCGPLVGTGLLAVLSVTTDVTLILLVKMSRALGVHTFGALMRKLFGKGGSAVFQLTLISVLFLALTAMQRVVLDLLPIFLESICGVEHGTVKPLAPLGGTLNGVQRFDTTPCADQIAPMLDRLQSLTPKPAVSSALRFMSEFGCLHCMATSTHVVCL